MATFRADLPRSAFGMAETSELLRRTWHVEERSVRPDHRMVAHTGFLTTARLLVPYEDGREAPASDREQDRESGEKAEAAEDREATPSEAQPDGSNAGRRVAGKTVTLGKFSPAR